MSKFPQISFDSALYKFLVALNLLQVLFGIAMVIAEEYVKYLLWRHMLDTEGTQTYMIMTLAEIYTVQLVFTHVCGILVAKRCNLDVYTEHLVLLMKIWSALGVVCSLEGLWASWIFYRAKQDLSEFLELEMFKGVEAYYLDPEWRLIWDNIQFHEKCCGVYDYRDWKNCWLYKMDTKVKQSTSNVSFIPYSCCENENDCYQNIIPILLKTQEINIPAIDASLIHQQGCIYGLLDECTAVLALLIALNLIVFIVQMVIVAVLRCLYVSKREFDYDDVLAGSALSSKK